MNFYSLFDIIFSTNIIGVYCRYEKLEHYYADLIQERKIVRISRNNIFLYHISNLQESKVSGL